MKPAERRRLRQEQEQPKKLRPLNSRQATFLRSINTNPLTVAYGPAGTSKTYIPAWRGIDMILDPANPLQKMILCRPAVPGGGEQHGFLPGDLRRKLEPWAAPILDVVEERVGSKTKMEEMVRSGMIEIIPFQFMRGRTFRDAFVILDEAQNTTPEQMKLFVTRLGENSKTVISGDVSGGQNDLGNRTSGLAVLIGLITRSERLRVQTGLIEFDRGDIVRSGLCQDFVEAFETITIFDR